MLRIPNEMRSAFQRTAEVLVPDRRAREQYERTLENIQWKLSREMEDMISIPRVLQVAAAVGLAVFAYGVYRIVAEDRSGASKRRRNAPTAPIEPEEHVVCLVVSDGDLANAFATGAVTQGTYERLANGFNLHWYGSRRLFSGLEKGLQQAQAPQTPYSVRSLTFRLPLADERFTTYLGMRDAIRHVLPTVSCEVSEPLDNKQVVTLPWD